MVTGEQLLAVFAAYNQQIWPMQILAYLLGIAALVMAFRRTEVAARTIAAILAFFWLWVALLFWLPSGSQGFTIGYLFSLIFLIQGLLFLVQAWRPGMKFGTYAPGFTWLGVICMLYALLGYPALGLVIGHVYPYTPPFGLTPCPLIIFMFGLLLLTRQPVPKLLLVIPFFYSLSGVLWISIGIYEDIGLVASGILGAGLLWYRDSKTRSNRAGEPSARPELGGWSLDLPEKK